MTTHRLLRRLPIAVCLLFAGIQLGAINPDNLNSISFRNRTGADIEYLYLSPGDSEYWGTDILGAENILLDGEIIEFFIHYPDRCNEFDIMAVDEFQDAYIIFDYEICDGTEENVRFTSNDEVETASDLDLMQIDLSNDTGFEILYLFVSPADSEMWGVDQMDAETTLADGGTISLLLPAVELRYDIHAVDEDGDSYTFFVDLDGTPGDNVSATIEFDYFDTE